jgi:hypothetical protein
MWRNRQPIDGKNWKLLLSHGIAMRDQDTALTAAFRCSFKEV